MNLVWYAGGWNSADKLAPVHTPQVAVSCFAVPHYPPTATGLHSTQRSGIPAVYVLSPFSHGLVHRHIHLDATCTRLISTITISANSGSGVRAFEAHSYGWIALPHNACVVVQLSRRGTRHGLQLNSAFHATVATAANFTIILFCGRRSTVCARLRITADITPASGRSRPQSPTDRRRSRLQFVELLGGFVTFVPLRAQNRVDQRAELGEREDLHQHLEHIDVLLDLLLAFGERFQ